MTAETSQDDSEDLDRAIVTKQQPKAMEVAGRSDLGNNKRVREDSGGPTIEDVTEDYDRGYEADLDGAYPDAFEEPESDNESSTSSQLKQQRSAHAALIKQFRKLRFGKRPAQPPARHAYHHSHGSTGTKRSHSEESLTETDIVASEGEPHSSPEHHQIKKRHLSADLAQEVVDCRDSDNAMEVDHIMPTSQKASVTL